MHQHMEETITTICGFDCALFINAKLKVVDNSLGQLEAWIPFLKRGPTDSGLAWFEEKTTLLSYTTK